jgi:cell division protein FtsI/penicillin-binding protein 2
MKKTNIRLAFIQICFTILAFLLISRLAYLQIYQHHFFKIKSKNQLNKIIHLYPNRGNIFDTNNNSLALTTTSYSIYAQPNKISNKWVFAKKLSKVFNCKFKEIYDLINNKYHFVWLKRKADKNIWESADILNLEGLGAIEVQKRVYPNDNLACDILGFVGIDNQGLAGLEYKYDTVLKGSPGKIMLEGDPLGHRLITGKQKKIITQDGSTIHITIDEYLQHVLQKHLKAGIEKFDAENGNALIMNPKTGDILAMSDYPFFNPNKGMTTDYKHTKNSCITDIFEPGSIFKAFTLAAVLEENRYTPESIITVPEYLKIANRTIREAHRRAPEESDKKTISEIIEYSLNVGTSLMAIELGQKKFYKYLTNFGFGTKTNIELPGESNGILRPLSRWSGVDIAMVSFGQGIAVTPIQIATAFSAIANGGSLLKPRIIKHFTKNNDQTLQYVPKKQVRQVISKQTAQQIKDILIKVVETGTATPAKIPGYLIAGKTGTAQKAKENGLGYEKGKYMSSFIGFFPANNPEYLILVVVDSPKKKYYGSTVACPIFRKIALDIINYKNILPLP